MDDCLGFESCIACVSKSQSCWNIELKIRYTIQKYLYQCSFLRVFQENTMNVILNYMYSFSCKLLNSF